MSNQEKIQAANRDLVHRLFKRSSIFEKRGDPLFPSDWVYATVKTTSTTVDGKNFPEKVRWIIKRPVNRIGYWISQDSNLAEWIYTSPEGKVPEGVFGFSFFLPNFGPFSLTNYQPKFMYVSTNMVSVEIKPIEPEVRKLAPSAAGDADALSENFELLAPSPKGEIVEIEGFSMIPRFKNSSKHSGEFNSFFQSASGAKGLIRYNAIPETKPEPHKLPMMEYWYYTEKFGGARVWVKLPSSALPLLQKIDEHIWQNINEYIVREIN